MPAASYYKDQARIFALWAMAATDPAIAQYLRERAEEYLALSEQPAPAPLATEPQQQIQSGPGDC